MGKWFETEVLKRLENSNKIGPFMDYWIAITSNEIGEAHFQWTDRAKGSDKFYSIMTTKN